MAACPGGFTPPWSTRQTFRNLAARLSGTHKACSKLRSPLRARSPAEPGRLGPARGDERNQPIATHTVHRANRFDDLQRNGVHA